MTADQPLLLVYLDPYHLGDPLFLRSFAQDVKAHIGPMILVHGSGEEAERALESRGLLSEHERSGPAARGLIERAIRDLNRRIVHELNDAGIPAIGAFGLDRGLLHFSDEGTLETGKADWLVKLVLQGGLPVLGALVRTMADDSVEASTAEVLRVLATAFGEKLDQEVALIVLTRDRKGGLFSAGTLINSLSLQELSSFDSVGDLDSIAQAAGTVRVRITSARSLRGEGLPSGTDLEP